MCDVEAKDGAFLLHEIYVTRSRFACGGRCVTGPPAGNSAFVIRLVGTLVLLVALHWWLLPVLLAPVLSPPIAPVSEGTALLLVRLMRLASAAVVVGMLRVHFSDPGIIPYRRDCLEIEYVDGHSSAECTLKQIQVGAARLTLRFCDRCQFFKPIGTEHCKVCDNCVLAYDSHSAALGNCVGMRNRKYYAMLLLACAVLCLSTGVLCLARLAVYVQALGWQRGLGHSLSLTCLTGASFYASLAPVLGLKAVLGHAVGLVPGRSVWASLAIFWLYDVPQALAWQSEHAHVAEWDSVSQSTCDEPDDDDGAEGGNGVGFVDHASEGEGNDSRGQTDEAPDVNESPFEPRPPRPRAMPAVLGEANVSVTAAARRTGALLDPAVGAFLPAVSASAEAGGGKKHS